MSAQVLQFASDDAIERAWACYAYRAALLRDDPSLMCDRAFNEELARLHERWRKLFIAKENAR